MQCAESVLHIQAPLRFWCLPSRAQKTSQKHSRAVEKGGFHLHCSKPPEDGLWTALGEMPQRHRNGSWVLPCRWLCASLGWGCFCRAAHVSPADMVLPQRRRGGLWVGLRFQLQSEKRGFLILWDQLTFHRGKLHPLAPVGTGLSLLSAK